jgi:hypothetical protein
MFFRSSKQNIDGSYREKQHVIPPNPAQRQSVYAFDVCRGTGLTDASTVAVWLKQLPSYDRIAEPWPDYLAHHHLNSLSTKLNQTFKLRTTLFYTTCE